MHYVGHKVKHRFFVTATPLLLFLLLDFITPMLADAMNWYIELSPLRLCNLASTNPSPTWIILAELILLTFVSVLTGIYRKYRHEVL